jgi:hypothetical protein
MRIERVACCVVVEHRAHQRIERISHAALDHSSARVDCVVGSSSMDRVSTDGNARNCGVWIMKRTHAIACTAMLLATTPALADGGVVAWTGERLDARAAVIVSPASMRVGAVEFAWIGPWRAGATVVATDQHGHTVSALLTQVAFDTEVRATLELPTEGVWNIALDPDGAEPAVSVVFPITLGAALPAWTAVWPQLFAWLPLCAIGLFAARRVRCAPVV